MNTPTCTGSENPHKTTPIIHFQTKQQYSNKAIGVQLVS